jgi:hypothetical protein
MGPHVVEIKARGVAISILCEAYGDKGTNLSPSAYVTVKCGCPEVMDVPQ